MKKSARQQTNQLNLFSNLSVQKKIDRSSVQKKIDRSSVQKKIDRNDVFPMRPQLKKAKPIKQTQREFSLLLTSKLKLNQWEIYLLQLTILTKNPNPFHKDANKNIEIIFKYYGTENIVSELINNHSIKIKQKLLITHNNFIIKDIKILKRLGYGIKE